MKFVRPKTFLLGCTAPSAQAISAYVHHVEADGFMQDWKQYTEQVGATASSKEGVSGTSLRAAEVLTSLYAKLCYKSLVSGHNPNVTRTRAIGDNLRAVIDSGHGSVLEHVTMNFVTTDCSRVFTHELVRHRTGIAFSQTSGRYVALSEENGMGFVMDPLLEKYQEDIGGLLRNLERGVQNLRKRAGVDDMSMADKKKWTSAIRRLLPTGQSNEIGWTANIRQLRHMIMMRTSQHAEWEIRFVFNEVYRLLKRAFPVFVYDAIETEIDGLLEISGMKVMPY